MQSELTQTQIKDNELRYIQLFEQLIVPEFEGAKELLLWIKQTDFFTAPASTKHHLNCAGGLCKHSLNVFTNLLNEIKFSYADDLEALETTQGGIALIALCHDLCKCNTYKIGYRNDKQYHPEGTKTDAGGKFDWVSVAYYKREPDFVLGHGSKSLFIVQNFILGMPLAEATAIRFHMGGMENPGSNFIEQGVAEAFSRYPLALLTYIADMKATYIDEKQ